MWSLRPREEQIKLLHELDEILIVGYPYTGRGKILDKLTPEDHSAWGLEKANTFMKELLQKYNCPRRKGNPRAWMTPQQQEDAQREEQRVRARRPSGPLPPGTKQLERPLPPPEPPPPTTNSSNSYHSEGSNSDSNSYYSSGRSISWGDEGSQQSGGPRSDSSWEDDSSWGSYAHSYGSSDSDYGATFVFGAGYPTAQQSATSAHAQPPTPLPPPPAEPRPAASIYRVTIRGPNSDVANYKIKEHTKVGEVCEFHAARWLTDAGSLRFLLDGEGIGVNQTPSTLSLTGFTDS